MQRAPRPSGRLAGYGEVSPVAVSRWCCRRCAGAGFPELGELKRYVENGDFLLEASDLGVVNMRAERKLPFVAGHAQLLQRRHAAYSARYGHGALVYGRVIPRLVGKPCCTSVMSWVFAISLKSRY